jgi:hypothetical protein
VTQWAVANLASFVAQAVAAGRAGELLNRVTDAYRAVCVHVRVRVCALAGVCVCRCECGWLCVCVWM